MTTVPVPASAHCPVCGSTLGEGRVVACARCETVHHQDCIEYGGGCAVYACGSRAYRKPGAKLEFVARPAPAPMALAKPVQITAVVETLARPVLRVDARRARSSQRVAQVVAVASAGAALYLLGRPAVWWIAHVFGGLRELWSIGFAVIGGTVLIALALLIVFARLGWDALVHGTGMLVHAHDAGAYELDRENRRLIRHTRFLGLPGPTRSWNACDVRAVRLIADPATERVRLEIVLDGGPLVLADDENTYPETYHWSELARLGQRLAAELDVPLEWLVPWKLGARSRALEPASPAASRASSSTPRADRDPA